MKIMYIIHGLIFPLVSFIMNCVFWWKHKGEWRSTTEKMNAQKVESLEDVRQIMGLFKYRDDGFLDWQPWIHTIFKKDLTEDCDGAAVLGKWLLKKISIKARIVRLWKSGKTEGHSVCVSWDNRIIISNNDVRDFRGSDLALNIEMMFKGDYDIIM